MNFINFCLLFSPHQNQIENWGEQVGGGVGGSGVHLYSWMHQEYTFRHKRVHARTQLSRQEYLTRRVQRSVGWKGN